MGPMSIYHHYYLTNVNGIRMKGHNKGDPYPTITMLPQLLSDNLRLALALPQELHKVGLPTAQGVHHQLLLSFSTNHSRVECPDGSAPSYANFGPESDPESGSYFDDPEPNPESGSYFDDPDSDYDDDDPDSDDDPDPEFVSDSDPDPYFDSNPDSSSYPDPNSYQTCILCIFCCITYDFSTNNPDTWTRLRILW
ncbi:hypothetical protein L3X38_042834 [Prunus dulcis]|uniref:Uncharacterized protein n=1 Tax=Prunus dulcis TaxID=3755 RepID=A0AAD4YMB9_PRUDU|nr:hypothetical protein L3X38_042834 [Prunus dulcis]